MRARLTARVPGLYLYHIESVRASLISQGTRQRWHHLSPIYRKTQNICTFSLIFIVSLSYRQKKFFDILSLSYHEKNGSILLYHVSICQTVKKTRKYRVFRYIRFFWYFEFSDIWKIAAVSYQCHIGWKISPNYHIGIISGGKLVSSIVSVSYWVENWSEVSYRYCTELNIETKLLSVSYRPAQNPVPPIPGTRTLPLKHIISEGQH